MTTYSFIFVFVSLLACLSPSRVLAAGNYNNNDNASLGVRLGLDKQFDANAYCVADERTKLRETIRRAVGLQTRKLRDSQQLQQCVELCDDSAPGHCFLAHKECQGWRRLQESSSVGDSLADDFVDPDPNAAILQNVSGGRYMASKRVVTPEMREACNEVSDKVVESLHKLTGVLDAPCKRLLRKEVEIECFLL